MNTFARLFAGICIAALLVSLTNAATPVATNNTRKTAIFVANHADKALDDKLASLADFITSRITEKGFSVLSREVATDALSGLLKDSKQTDADQLLSNNSTVLRLGQLLGADYLIVASISSVGVERKTSDVYGVKTVNVTHTLRVSYKVLEGAQGGSLIGDTAKVSKTIRLDVNNQTEDSDVLNELLDEAANSIAANAGQKVGLLTDISAKQTQVEITISCGMQDLVQLPSSLPDIRLLDDNKTIYVSTNRLPMQVLSATVEMDGIAIGTAPGKFKVRPGMSKMRITRDGFNVYERTVNCFDGQEFNNVPLQMSDAGYARWKDNMTFLLAIKSGDKLTDGLREMMGGFAQTLRQSGYRVDTKTDVKATIEAKGKSLFDGATLKVFGQ